MFAANNLTAIAIRITPNTFLITFTPFLPSIFSIFTDDLSTIKTKIIFTIIAIIMFSTKYSALKESKDVSVPAPAINGKAMGTIEALSGSSSLYS